MKIRRILLILAGTTVGSTTISLPAIHAVQRHFGPEAEMWLLYRSNPSSPTKPTDVLLEDAHIKGFLSLAQGFHPKKILALLWKLWRLRFELAIYVDSSGISAKSLRAYKLLTMAAGITRRIGFYPHVPQSHRADPRGASPVFKQEAIRRLENMRRDGVDISLESDFSRPFLPLSDATRHTVQTWLQGRRRYPEKSLIAVCPGARSQSNTWPLKRFTEIGRRLINLGAYEVVVCGGPAEYAAGELLVQEWGEGINAAGSFSVLESAALLEGCRFMVGLDTGATHLAAAVGAPCITLQGGRMRPGHWDPLGNNHTVLRFPVPCDGCRLTTCRLSMHPCMKGISVEMVWQAILKKLHKDGASP